ncbi:sugar phosphate isomerase/epimerase family protein [Marinobacter zhejiangensis]|uniref:Sugar phosphate isomerase/epimerase n=1 Tax=Marinobacter zhejiangensis TaxID=488535 RepID=A0A1I4TQH1_9GAMM|nr:TIM barrel protein [Marinobacter zhejiangensis]SFM79012.1 Sugar phosphate isomerase/epimerase [Marinobacter zhejiangensis]
METKRSFSLHHLTVLDAAPSELPGYAAQTGCSYIGIFCDLPGVKEAGYPVVSPGESEQQLQRALSEHGVSINNLELFQLRPETDVSSFNEVLAMGQRLGARQATVHMHDGDGARSVATFAKFCELAGGYGLDAALEFTSFSAVRTLDTALQIVRSANMSNGRIALDLLHFFRNGGNVEMLSAIAPHELGYVQVCDGLFEEPEDRYAEAVKDRMLPGDGEFPIAQVMARIPELVIVDVEVPQMRFKKLGATPAHRVRSAVKHTVKAIQPPGVDE